LIGVSGGADSVCLMLVLRDLGYDISVAHLNHGLRGSESDGDEEFVRNLCAHNRTPYHVQRINLAESAGNLEAAGRFARREFFESLACRLGFDAIALAHNLNDRVETFLLNLIRGSGVDGLTSLEPVSGKIIRPLIESSRAEIEADLRSRGQTWRDDSTNADIRFARNRLRLEVIPTLAQAFNPKLVETLNRTIEILDEENSFFSRLTDEWLSRHAHKSSGSYSLDAEALVTEPSAMQRRIVRMAIKTVAGGRELHDVGFHHIESVRELLAPGRSGKRIEIPGGITVWRSFQDLIVEKDVSPVPDFDYELQIPGQIHIPEIGRTFRASIVSIDGKWDREAVFADGSELGHYVRIRNWKPGDYYRPVGLPAGKLKKLFQRARIPRSQRHRWPVVVTGSSIVWVASFPISREFAPRGCSQRIVAFEASPN